MDLHKYDACDEGDGAGGSGRTVLEVRAADGGLLNELVCTLLGEFYRNTQVERLIDRNIIPGCLTIAVEGQPARLLVFEQSATAETTLMMHTGGAGFAVSTSSSRREFEAAVDALVLGSGHAPARALVEAAEIVAACFDRSPEGT